MGKFWRMLEFHGGYAWSTWSELKSIMRFNLDLNKANRMISIFFTKYVRWTELLTNWFDLKHESYLLIRIIYDAGNQQ